MSASVRILLNMDVQKLKLLYGNSPTKVVAKSGFEATMSRPTDEVQSTNDMACHICQKMFPEKILLNRHKKTHSLKDELSIFCNICQKMFTKRENLKKHKRIHTLEDKPSKCEVCSKVFKRKDMLMSHFKRMHNDGMVGKDRHAMYV